MIENIIKISTLYVLIYGFTRIFFKSGAFIVKYFFYIGMILIVFGFFGPPLRMLLTDIHNVSTAYTSTKAGIENGMDAVQNLPDTLEKIPGVGVGPGKKPPAISFKEKIWPFGTKYFSYPVSGRITQGFGPDNHGIDIACNSGTAVIVSRPGVVKEIGQNDVYGDYILIDHGSQWQTLYAHLSQIAVKKGQNIFANGAIGLSGSTGNSTGPHLHFEIRVGGKAIDPKPYMK